MMRKKPTYFLYFLLIVVSLLSFPIFGEDKKDASFKVTPLLKNLGFIPVTPQEAPSFSFPSINQGKDISLSDNKGKWQFLVFWATWCGPCLYELPIIESIYQELPKDQVAILGISVDQDQKNIKKFLDKKNLNFPVVWDHKGEASRFFNASSIPLMVVISPDLKVVALFRGANNWESPGVMAALKELVSHRENLEFLSSDSTASGEKLELANDLIPPEIKIETSKNEVETGFEFEVKVIVSFKGDSKEYLLKVPKITKPDRVDELSVSSYSDANEGESETIYSFKYQIWDAGEYKLGPVEMEFIPRVGGRPQFSRGGEITITVNELLIVRILPWLALGVVIILVGGIIFFVFFKKKKVKNLILKSKENKRKELKEYPERFLVLKGQRLQISPKEYTTKIMIFWKELLNYLEKDSSDQKRELENIKYAGKILSSEELNSIEKEIEREFKTLQDDETMEEN